MLLWVLLVLLLTLRELRELRAERTVNFVEPPPIDVQCHDHAFVRRGVVIELSASTVGAGSAREPRAGDCRIRD